MAITVTPLYQINDIVYIWYNGTVDKGKIIQINTETVSTKTGITYSVWFGTRPEGQQESLIIPEGDIYKVKSALAARITAHYTNIINATIARLNQL